MGGSAESDAEMMRSRVKRPLFLRFAIKVLSSFFTPFGDKFGNATVNSLFSITPILTQSTSEIVEASGTARPGEIVSTSNRNTTVNRNPVGRPLPTRPWEQTYGTMNNNYGGYGSTLSYNSGYGSGMYGSYCGLGGLYGGGMYGNSMYRGGDGGLYGSGMYGGGLYNGGFGGPIGGFGMGMGGPYGSQDPNNPYGAPPSPPGFWISVLRVQEDRLSPVREWRITRFSSDWPHRLCIFLLCLSLFLYCSTQYSWVPFFFYGPFSFHSWVLFLPLLFLGRRPYFLPTTSGDWTGKQSIWGKNGREKAAEW